VSTGGPDAYSSDYDTNPSRFRVGSESAWKYGQGDVHQEVAERFAEEHLVPVLDLGCGEGRLIRLLGSSGLDAVGLDRSLTMLHSVQGPRILGDARTLPFSGATFGGVAALYMLYHLPDPRLALKEAHRVLKSGGLFVAATPSRYTDPEFADVQPPEATTFDAEDATEMIAEIFVDVETEKWDGPFITLPTSSAVADYLFGRGMERSESEAVGRKVTVPLSVTKRGSLVWGRKNG
jgi:SAM-dependent methyltransferase